MLQLRKKYKVKVEGDEVPDLVDSFAKMQKKFKLTESFMQKIKEAGYKQPTPIQM